MSPFLSTVRINGSSWLLIGAVFVVGRFPSPPCIIIGAVTMKITSNTSITSTRGVTLMSDIKRFPFSELIAIYCTLLFCLLSSCMKLQFAITANRTTAEYRTAEFRRVVSFDIRHSLFDIRYSFSQGFFSDQTGRLSGQRLGCLLYTVF